MKRTQGAALVAIGLLITAYVFVQLRPNASSSPLVVIFMENKTYTKLEAYPATSHAYMDAFAAGGTRFTHYTEGTATGPSLPDYLGFAAGSACGKTSDTVKAGDPVIGAPCPTTVWNQLETAGISWGVYMDGMPSACSNAVNYTSIPTDGPYALKHNPATPFPSIWSNQTLCKTHVLPYTSFDVNALPAVSFISPNMCNDQHGTKQLSNGVPKYQNCYPNSSELINRGDQWLAAHVPAMLAAGAEVVITYDEPGVMYAAVQGGGVSVGTVATSLTHYGLLRAVEDRYGLSCLNAACSATPVPL